MDMEMEREVSRYLSRMDMEEAETWDGAAGEYWKEGGERFADLTYSTILRHRTITKPIFFYRSDIFLWVNLLYLVVEAGAAQVALVADAADAAVAAYAAGPVGAGAVVGEGLPGPGPLHAADHRAAEDEGQQHQRDPPRQGNVQQYLLILQETLQHPSIHLVKTEYHTASMPPAPSPSPRETTEVELALALLPPPSDPPLLALYSSLSSSATSSSSSSSGQVALREIREGGERPAKLKASTW